MAFYASKLTVVSNWGWKLWAAKSPVVCYFAKRPLNSIPLLRNPVGCTVAPFNFLADTNKILSKLAQGKFKALWADLFLPSSLSYN